jgi:hypothetical protein
MRTGALCFLAGVGAACIVAQVYMTRLDRRIVAALRTQ